MPSVRRAPRYARMIVTGIVLGSLVAALLAYASRGQDGSYSWGQVALYLGVLLAAFGGLVGGFVAVRLDGEAARPRPRTRRRRPSRSRPG
ncbi:MAG: hypothetical protein ACYCXA_07120 [Actinomycetes bacterium]